jgi:hypothetical protein
MATDPRESLGGAGGTGGPMIEIMRVWLTTLPTPSIADTLTEYEPPWRKVCTAVVPMLSGLPSPQDHLSDTADQTLVPAAEKVSGVPA